MPISEHAHKPTIGQDSNRAHQLLLDFLRDNDAACPVCGYNVRALTRPICPECKQELALTVGVTRLEIGWLIAALMPGFFSGIAACFLAIPTTAIYFEEGAIVWGFVGVVLFGWCSGIFAIIFGFRKRMRIHFIAQSRRRQQGIVLIIWFIHFAALVAFAAWLVPQI